ncbi:alpha-ketoglutarate-dependent dioxygenase AlkB family protein [Crocinitomix algicola]|uniref:alpha-ketoglutarate-dependent dioxygenase AlkB family protein n=1 Tax=Crocinitomix algicola TaxID=1740263 RepID=UPI000836D570|nr:alpha-ketoglutarate-dependent dioxygenase AlkB [Crocinitomix algicola]
MKLFPEDGEKNWLPYNGVVNYFGIIMNAQMIGFYFNHLMHEIPWRHDEAHLYGKRIITKRKVAWYGDEPFPYRYSGTTKTALPWTKELLELKVKVEQRTKETFNSCLLNLYHDGSEGMAWHSDGERELKKNGAIAALSLGAERKFSLKHKKDRTKINFLLENGSLLVMKGETQTYWLHRIPPTKKVFEPRISLTFRTIAKEATI